MRRVHIVTASNENECVRSILHLKPVDQCIVRRIESTHKFEYKITNSRLTALSICKSTGCTGAFICRQIDVPVQYIMICNLQLGHRHSLIIPPQMTNSQN